MTRIFGLCPRCKSRVKINDAERMDGRKIVCRECGYSIRIRASKAALASNQSEELEVVEFVDEDGDNVLFDNHEATAAHAIDEDEFAAAIDKDSEIPAYQPLARRPKAKKKSAKTSEDEDGSGSFVPKKDAKSGPRKGKQSPLVVGLICGGALLVIGGLAGGLVLLRTSGFGTPAKFEPPEKYVPIPVGLIPLAGAKPEGWKSKSGGGMQGIPIFVTISDDSGSISIDIRETEGSSAKGQRKKRLLSGQEVNQIGGPPTERVGEAPAVAGTHAYHKDVVMKNFSNYKESSGQPIETGFGEGFISDFTAEEGLFHGRVKGCRASLVHRERQFSIVCKCPPAQFKDVKPVFEKVIASLNPDEGPGGPR